MTGDKVAFVVDLLLGGINLRTPRFNNSDFSQAVNYIMERLMPSILSERSFSVKDF